MSRGCHQPLPHLYTSFRGKCSVSLGCSPLRNRLKLRLLRRASCFSSSAVEVANSRWLPLSKVALSCCQECSRFTCLPQERLSWAAHAEHWACTSWTARAGSAAPPKLRHSMAAVWFGADLLPLGDPAVIILLDAPGGRLLFGKQQIALCIVEVLWIAMQPRLTAQRFET